MKSWKGKLAETWLTVAVALLGLSALVAAIFLTVSRSTDDPTSRSGDSVIRTTETSGPSKAPTKVLALGSVAKIGSDYRVAVTEVNVYEGTVSPFVAATIKAKYIGDKKGNPPNDLAAKYFEADAQTIESTCESDFGAPDLSDLGASSRASMANGDVKTYVVCIPVPTKTVDKGSVSIEASASDGLAAWTTNGAEAKALPAPKPLTPVGPAPTNPAATKKALEKLEKQLKKAKKARDKLDDNIDKAKKIEGYDNDDLDDLEDAKDDLDDAIDDMEKIRDKLRAAL
jgi:hypothetical protein